MASTYQSVTHCCQIPIAGLCKG